MRKILLASAAMLSTTAGMAFAQEGNKNVVPAFSGVSLNAPVSAAGANNNNNIGAAAMPGPGATPTPGTFAIRLGGRVNVEFGTGWSSVDSISVPAGYSVNALTVNGTTGAQGTSTIAQPGGTAATSAQRFKRNPYGMGTYFRLYPGLDAMATNGLRYGAASELRTNWGGSVGGGSGETSGQTMFVRRAFVYLAGDNWGLVRVGQGDGITGLFDGGVTTSQNWSNSGVLNGGDAQTVTPGRTAIPFYWMSLAGNEYGTNKIVYVSPKFYGVEVGANYTPSTGNLYSDGGTSPYTLQANCAVPSSTCSSLSSSTVAGDAGRYTDLYSVGLRYLNDVGPVNVRALYVYTGSGQVSYQGAAPAGRSVAGYFNALSVNNVGLAATYAGFTLGANWIGGVMNGQYALKPAGGANLNATTAGLQYVTGPLTLGVTGAVAFSQGSASLVGQTQQREQEVSFGGRYTVAPGLAVSADYIYQIRKQNGFNYAFNTTGAGYNQIQAQAFLLGVAVNW